MTIENQTYVSEKIKKFLELNNINIVNKSNLYSNENSLVKLAVFMGDNIIYRKSIFKIIKNNLAPVKTFNVSLKSFSEPEKKMLFEFLYLLKNGNLISEYNLSKNFDCVIVHMIRSSLTRNFLSGLWFEVYTKEKILNKIKDHCSEADYSLETNVRIKMPDGSSGEIDMILAINDEMYFFEMKSGKIIRHCKSFRKLINCLKMKVKNNFMILLEGTENYMNNISGIGFKTLNFENFYVNFGEYIKMPTFQEPAYEI